MKKLILLSVVIFFAFTLTGCEDEPDDDCNSDFYSSNCVTEPIDTLSYASGTYEVGSELEPGIYLFKIDNNEGTISRMDEESNVIAEVTLPTRTYFEIKSTDATVVISGGSILHIDDSPAWLGLTMWEEGGYIVGTEVIAGDYLFSMDVGETSATINILSAVDFETDSIIESITISTTGDTLITIPSTAYAVYITDGSIVESE